MREQIIDSEKWYLMTHGQASNEGEELAREEYEAKNEDSSCFSDMRCQKVERYGILATGKQHKEKMCDDTNNIHLNGSE